MGIESDLSGEYYHDEAAVRVSDGTGCEVWVPENRGYGERQVGSAYCDRVGNPDNCTYWLLDLVLESVGISILDKNVYDAVEVMAYADDGASPMAIGGLSRGSAISIRAASANLDMVDAVFLASGPSSQLRLPPSIENQGTFDLTVGDVSDMALTLIPTPVYVSHGRGELFVWAHDAESGITGGVMEDAYRLAGAEEGLTYVAHDGGHRFHFPSLLEFLNGTLHAAPR